MQIFTLNIYYRKNSNCSNKQWPQTTCTSNNNAGILCTQDTGEMQNGCKDK